MGGAAPWWVGVLEAANDWGCKPWELYPDDGEVTWYLRWTKYREILAKAKTNGRTGTN